jgi:hypothetical protein
MKNKTQNTVTVQPEAATAATVKVPTIAELIGKFNDLNPLQKIELGNQIVNTAKGELQTKLAALDTERATILATLGTASPEVPSTRKSSSVSTPGEIRLKGKKLEALKALKGLGKPSTVAEIEEKSGAQQLNYILNKQLLPAGFISKIGEGRDATFSYVKGL